MSLWLKKDSEQFMEKHQESISVKNTIYLIRKETIIMSIYKDKKTGNWVVTLRYKDLDGIIKRRAKRGFTTKREAKDWKDDFLSSISHVEAKEMEMTFEEFYKVYLSDISNLI